MVSFKDASREKSKLRIALTGVSGGGKTLGALLLASGLTGGDWGKIVLIDTERRRGLLYANRSDLGTGCFKYAELTAPYSPDRYKEYVAAAAELAGPDGVVIIDSLSHAWSYTGGVLDIKDEIAAQRGQNSYTAWNQAGKVQNGLVDFILSANCHTICTLRVKQDYIMTENDKGKQMPVKVGLAPVQRDDMEYEFDIVLSIARSHIATASKDVTFLDGLNQVITPELGRQLAEWANEGKEPDRCADCGHLLRATRKMTAAQLASYTRDSFGRLLCASCAARLLKEQKETAHEAE